ncbi:MAG: winged helix-turn-helix transcriptional regulator [Candidatus Bathyarchaeota archaeon]|nr:MAG: winged helix-turn-helix transcriptional regulator [Candidatus Bathyarchaeota archaeon]
MNILREKGLNIGEIASQLNMTPQAVHHHMKKLEKAGLINVVYQERRGHLIESYYRTTAQNYICYDEESRGESTAPVKENLNVIMDGLKEIGFPMEVDEEKLTRLVKAQNRIRKFRKVTSPADQICARCGDAGFFLKSGPIDPVKSDRVYYYANLMLMSDEEYEKRVDAERALRQLLLSLRSKQTQKEHT